MRWMTHLGGARATLAVGLALVALGEPRLGLTALLANAGSHMLVQLLKRAVARARPCDAGGRPLALVDLPDPHSFASGHAALVAYSRVTLRVHHVSDVVAGAALGLTGAVVAARLLR